MSKRSKTRKTRRTKQAPKPAETKPNGGAPFTFTGNMTEFLAAADKLRAELPAPTFTLDEVRRAFGWNYGTDRADPIDVACDVIDDVKRTLFLVNNVVFENEGTDEHGASDVLTNAWNRCEAALVILNKFRPCVMAKAGGAS
jgi:hypothetical protein